MTHRPTPSQPARRLVGMDALRGLAFLAIFAFHNWQNCGSPQLAIRLPNGAPFALGRIFAMGGYGTTVFFVLSGFLLALPYWRGRTERVLPYMWRRLRRIYPPYVVAIVVHAALIAGLGWDYARLGADALLHLLLVHNLAEFSAFGLSPPIWYMAPQVQLYLAVPLFFWIARLRPGRAYRTFSVGVMWVVCGLSVLAVGPALAWVVRVTRPPAHILGAGGMVLMTSPLVRAAEFVTGIALGGVYLWLEPKRPTRLRWAAPAGMIGLAMVVPRAWLMPYHLWPRVPLVIAAATLALALIDPASWLARLLDRGPLRWLGLVSFGAYLYHGLTLSLSHHAYAPTADRLAPGHPLWARTAVAFGLSMLAGTASYLVIERPILRWLRRPE